MFEVLLSVEFFWKKMKVSETVVLSLWTDKKFSRAENMTVVHQSCVIRDIAPFFLAVC